MIAFNSEKYIGHAIQSILDQTYTNLELIIVDDGSTDNTFRVINSFQDSRISLIMNNNNRGIPFSRNKALKASSGEYIAVLDADDISLNIRIHEQVKFLKNNPSFGLVGGLSEVIDNNGKNMNIYQGKIISPEESMVHLLFRNCFIHSTIMYKKDVIKVYGFNNEFDVCEDYDLIVNVAQKNKVQNLNKVVSQYRIHKNNISKTNRHIDYNNKKIIFSQLSKMGLSVNNYDYKIHKGLTKKKIHHDNNLLISSLKWLDKLYRANKRKEIFPKKEFYKKVSGYWFNFINNPLTFSPRLLIPYFQSKILWDSNRGPLEHIKFVVKCILFWKIDIVEG